MDSIRKDSVQMIYEYENTGSLKKKKNMNMVMVYTRKNYNDV
jgi:hypothetical protein